ncbi:MAG: polysaccharide deacetylase family protein, partial [Pseudomonadota bacterium]
MADNLKFTREGGEATGPAPRNRMAARAVAAVISALFALAALSTAAGVEPKRIVLSFDDAPRGDGRVFAGAARATALIEGLRAAEVEEVVFFVTTRGFEAQPDGKARVERYAAAGHLIANHSHTHPWAHQTGVADYLADVDLRRIAPFVKERKSEPGTQIFDPFEARLRFVDIPDLFELHFAVPLTGGVLGTIN